MAHDQKTSLVITNRSDSNGPDYSGPSANSESLSYTPAAGTSRNPFLRMTSTVAPMPMEEPPSYEVATADSRFARQPISAQSPTSSNVYEAPRSSALTSTSVASEKYPESNFTDSPTPEPGPEQTSHEQQISNIATFDVSASSWTRPVPAHIPQTTFKPLFLRSRGKHLDEGFPAYFPTGSENMDTQLFAAYDLQLKDWLRFLDNLKVAGTLSAGEQIAACALPVLALNAAGLLVWPVIHKKMRKDKKGVVGGVVDTWNEQFFAPRRLQVTLMHGKERLSGDQSAPVPLPPWDKASQDGGKYHLWMVPMGAWPS